MLTQQTKCERCTRRVAITKRGGKLCGSCLREWIDRTTPDPDAAPAAIRETVDRRDLPFLDNEGGSL